MHYALSPYVWTAGNYPILSAPYHYRPRGCDPGRTWSAIDLRPDASKIEGYALIATPEPVPGAIDLGDEPDLASPAVRRSLRSRLGISLQASDLRAGVLELLTREAWGKRRWLPLRPAGHVWEIWLGGLFLRLPVMAGGATLSDNFGGTGAPLDGRTASGGGTWSKFLDTGGGDFVTTGTACRVDPSAFSEGEVANRLTTNLDTADHESYFTITAFTSGDNTQAGPLVRKADDAVQSFFAFIVIDAGAVQRHDCVKFTSGTGSLVGSSVMIAIATVPLRLRIVGSSLTGYINDVAQFTATDTSFPTNRQAGVLGTALGSGGVIEFTPWGAQDVAAPAVNTRVWVGLGPG